MSSGFLCPECHQDQGSVDALMAHFKLHQTEQDTNGGIAGGIKKLLQKKSDMTPSQKALDKEEEERRRIMENDALLTTTGGVDTSIWSRQEIGARRSRMSAFRQHRGTSERGQLEVRANSLQATINRLLEIATQYSDAAERKKAEQEAVVWAPDEAAPHCMNCGLKFGLESTLILSGRHHCRLCGACICRDCCQALFYHGLAETVNAEQEFDPNETLRTCEYCVVEVMRLKEQRDQNETGQLVLTLYGRFHRVRANVTKLIDELGRRSHEPLAAKQIADVMENEMKKLDRLSKQIANVEDVDARLGTQIRKLTQLMLQDAKFAIIKHRSNGQHSGSSSSSRASPSAPSTPIRTMTPPPLQPTKPPPPEPAKQFSPLASNGLQNVKSMPTFKIRPTSYQLPDEESLIRKSDTNSNRLSHLTQSKTSSECSSTNPSNPFGEFEQATTTPGNPFGEVDSDEDELVETTADDSERQVQIRFMRKEIKKLVVRGDMAKADMVRQVLDEMLNA